MPYSITGLPSNGRTNYFNFQYDDTLTAPRGKDLAIEMLKTCDADLATLAAWFSGRQLDMSPPIMVSINTVATDAMGNPTQFVGGHWMGALLVPLQVTINIGELPMATGRLIMLARYLLISEVSEMYMRAFSPYGFNPWFRLGEGNKGEGLSRFLAEQFLLKAYPGVAGLPSLTVGTWNCTSSWLNSARSNFLEINDEDIDPAAPTSVARRCSSCICTTNSATRSRPSLMRAVATSRTFTRPSRATAGRMRGTSSVCSLTIITRPRPVRAALFRVVISHRSIPCSRYQI
jgi:hypothetical protein